MLANFNNSFTIRTICLFYFGLLIMVVSKEDKILI